MPRKVTPGFHRKQERGETRRGETTTFYLPRTLLQALDDMARARGISRAKLVRGIVEADPDVAAQMALYPDQGPGDWSGSDQEQEGGAYAALFADQPDLWGSDQGEALEVTDQPDQRPEAPKVLGTYDTTSPTYDSPIRADQGHPIAGSDQEQDDAGVSPDQPGRWEGDQRPMAISDQKSATRGRGKMTFPTNGSATSTTRRRKVAL